MGNYIWPVDNFATGGASYTGRRLRQLLGTVWGGGGNSRPLGGPTGVVQGSYAASPTVLTANSSIWAIAIHAGVIDAETAAIAGPYVYSVDAYTTGAMAAADAAQTRIDIVSMQVSDPTESDGTSAPGIAPVYTVGTPGGGQPATPPRSLLLGVITVPKTGAGSPTVVQKWVNVVANGGISVASSATLVGQYVGDTIFDTVKGVLSVWNGTTWDAYRKAPVDSGWLTTGMSAGTCGVNATRYRTIDNLVILDLSMSQTAALTIPSNGNMADVTNITLPASIAPGVSTWFAWTTDGLSGSAKITTGGLVQMADGTPSGTIAAGAFVFGHIVYTVD